MSEVQVPFFWALFCSVFVGFYLTHFVYVALRDRHPQEYAALGSPTLVTNNSPRSGLTFQKFLYTGSWRSLNDPNLANRCLVLLVFQAVYFVCFATLLISTFVNGAQ